MQVSFIIPLFNCLPFTQAMLASLRSTLPPELAYEIILVDDGSTDGTREWLATLSDPAFRIILNEQNLGYAGANNRGAAVARGEFLALLNNDLVLTPRWLEPMLAGLTSLPRVGLVGNVQLNARTRRIDHRGVRFDQLGRPLHMRNRWAFSAYSPRRAVTAACCLVRADVFRGHHGFDPAFVTGYEDVDLCLRLRLQGFRHYVANRSCVLHHVSVSPGRHANEARNLALFLARWGPPGGVPSFRNRGFFYWGRYWNRPWRFNGPKLCLALAWMITNRACDNLSRRLGTTLKP